MNRTKISIAKANKALLKLLFSIVVLMSFVSHSNAQSLTEDVLQNALRKPDSEKNGIIVLQFDASGMTESAARAFSIMVAQNLANTNRFDVIPLEDVETEAEKSMPNLLPCFAIGCGIQMGKLMESDWILSGHISLTTSGMFSLNVKLVFIFDNSLAFEDTIRFTDETRDRPFYQLANRVADNAPVLGRIVEANNKIAVIDLGEKNGVTVGDQLVIYRNLNVRTDSGEVLSESVRRKNIGILRITKLGKNISEGVYFQTIETPEARQFVTTFLDKRKQIQLVDETRKELDTHLRNVFEIKQSVELSPVKLEDRARKQWTQKVRALEGERDLWQTILIGSGVASGYLLYQFKSGDDLQLLAALGALGYSGYRYFSIRSQLNELVDEGRYKGYLELKIRPEFGEVELSYKLRF